MTAQPGWYDAGVPGKQRWWDGTQWTAHEREIAPQPPVVPQPPASGFAGGVAGGQYGQQAYGQQQYGQQQYAQPAAQPQYASTAASVPQGWYQVPGEADVRWWDGTTWTPYRLRDGAPKADAFAVEPPATAMTLAILFLVIGLMQFGTAALGSRSFGTTGLLFLIVGAVWLIGAMHTSGLRKKPAPQSGAVQPDVVRPLPGEAEGAGAGWYPVAGQVTRWWTGTRWSWYIGQKYGVRPGHAGPRGYRVSMILGWVMAGVGVLALLAGLIGVLTFQSTMLLAAFGAGALVFGVIIALLGGLILLLTHQRRYMMILPTKAPPLR